MTQQIWVGIDVSKSRLDVATYPLTQQISVPNTQEGFAKLATWLGKRHVMAIAVEATGGYERDVVRAFQSRYTVRVLNPRRVRRFADAITPAKNDRIDARIIAHFAATISGEPAPPDDPVRSCVDELVKLRQLLCTHRVALQNSRRLAQAPEVRALLDQQIQAFATAIKQAERDIETTIRRSPKLLQTRNLVMSMPGIGPVVAAALVSQLPELGQVSTAKLAAIVGVAPFNDDSGGRGGPRHIAGGRKMMRNLLYMGSLSARSHNPVMRAFHERLIAKGKLGKVALVAVMHKMLARLNAMVHTNQPWNAEHARATP